MKKHHHGSHPNPKAVRGHATAESQKSALDVAESSASTHIPVPNYFEDDIEMDFDEYDVSHAHYSRAAQYTSPYRNQKIKTSFPVRFFAWFFTCLFIGLSGLLSYVLMRYQILPIKHRYAIMGSLLLICVIFLLLTIQGHKRRLLAKTAIVMAIIFSLIIGAGNYYIIRGVSTLVDITKNSTVMTKQVGIAVLKDSSIQSIQDLQGKKVLAPLKTDAKTIADYQQDLEARTQLSLQFEMASTYVDAATALYQQTAVAMFVNLSWLETIKEKYPDFLNEIRFIDESDLTQVVEDIKKDVNTSQQPFNIYISGIDTYGSIETVSRSDVNILMTINPKTNHLLLTTVPRDSRVRIPGEGQNEYDKLTHAGVYGVEASVNTLEQLLQTEINYYIRVNFSSLIKMVDTVGGIEVENPNEFSAQGFHYAKGTIHLNGEEALAFSRERYSLPGGDFERGRNQQRVIIGLFKKLTSPQLLTNYHSILNKLSDSLQTNLPIDAMMGVANGMIERGAFSWNMEMVDVKGSGQMGLSSFLMPGYELYMFVPSEESLTEIQGKIKAVLTEGEDPGSTASVGTTE